MNPILRTIAAGILVLSQLLSPAAAAADKNAAATATITDMLESVYTTNKSRGPGHLKSAIQPYFDFDWWTKFLIKPRKDQFTPEQAQKVRELMPGYIAHLYRERLSDGLDRQPEVKGSRSVKRSVLVTTHFFPSSGKLKVDWRVRDRRGKIKVYDIMVGGISFVLTTKDDFVAIIDRSGPRGLIDYLDSVAL